MKIFATPLSVFLAIGLVASAGFAASALAASNPEPRFDELQAGTVTYKNVTVTSKGRDYIFISHSTGMTSIKLSELSEETKLALGFAPPPKPKSQVAMEKLKSVEVPKLNEEQARQIDEKLSEAFGPSVPRVNDLNGIIKPWMVAAFLGFVLFCYWFFCYCAMLICKKTGNEPGVMVWLPVLQIFPLLKAAGMSPLWFVGFLLPVFNIVAQIIWSFKIANARGKGVLTGIFLLLPLTNLFAFLYLAFSAGSDDGKPARRTEGRPTLMTLEAA